MGLFNLERKVSAVFLLLVVYSVDAQVLPIGSVQGMDAQSPFLGKTVSIAGVVTSTFLEDNQLDGFFLQDRGDADERTSDAIFVYCPSCTTVTTGDSLVLTGDVEEYFGLTELTHVLTVDKIADGKPLPEPIVINSSQDLEKYEAMRVRLANSVLLTDNSALEQFGQVTVSTCMQVQPSDVVDPNDSHTAGTTWQGSSNVFAVDSFRAYLENKAFVLDDGSEILFPDLQEISPTITDLRIGSTLDSLQGVLYFSFGQWKILSPDAWNEFLPTERPLVPELRADLRVVSLNVANHFNGNGSGSGFNLNRGPKDQEEYELQRSKIAAAIQAMSPTICGLMEIENDGFDSRSAAQNLMQSINTTSKIQYDLVSYSNMSDNLIQNVIFYDANVVRPTSTLQVLGDRMISQDFELLISKDVLKVVFVHLKSKSCRDAEGDDLDQGDGQGCFNLLRIEQIAALLDRLSTDSLQRIVIMGDFNSYRQEDPLDLMRSRGWQDALEQQRATFRFAGKRGALDHAMVSPELKDHVHDAQVWKINEPEPTFLRYDNAEFASTGPYACSDHDPLILDLSFVVTHAESSAASTYSVFPNPTAGEMCILTANTSDSFRATLFNNVGHQVGKWSDQDLDASACLNIQSLPSGIYLLRVGSQGLQQVFRVVVN